MKRMIFAPFSMASAAMICLGCGLYSSRIGPAGAFDFEFLNFFG
jgi:hypothetical protein